MVNLQSWLHAAQALTSYTSSSIPKLGIALEPAFHSNGTVSYIGICINVQNDLIRAGDPFLQHYLNIAYTPTVSYNSSSILLDTPKGRVELLTKDFATPAPPTRKFYTTTDVIGDFSLRFNATPHYVNELSKCGSEAGLQYEYGGVIGAGMSFIPELLTSVQSQWEITISWNLKNAPVGITAVSTFGEKKSTSFSGTASIVSNSLFAVGSLQRYPRQNKKFGMYWFSAPPFNATFLASQMEVFSSSMTKLFNDKVEDYRIFVRRNENKCAGGMGFYRSFIFSWSTLTPRPPSAFFDLVAHEAVHEWALIDSRPPKPGAGVAQESWWTEGIAEYYGIVLPYKFGIVSKDEYVHNMNRKISFYFTSEYLHTSYDDIAKDFWDNFFLNRMIYSRGFMYFVNLATELRNNGLAHVTLDDLIKRMVTARLTGDEPYDLGAWLSLVASQLGNETANKQYQDVLDGINPIVPLPKKSLPMLEKYKLERQDQERFQLGFSTNTLFDTPPRLIKDLDIGSRAAVEGHVQNGDEVLQNGTSSLYDAGQFDAKMVLRVKRNGNEMELRWWPRAWEKVESWQWVD